MNEFEKYKTLSKLGFEYDSANTKDLNFEATDDIKSELSKIKISFTESFGKLSVNRNDLPFSFFETDEEFKKQVSLSDLNKPVVIHQYENEDSLFYDGLNTKLNDKLISNYLISNAKAYHESKDFFSKLSKTSDSDFEFVDFYSANDRRITFVSLTEKRRLHLRFQKAGVINLDENTDYLTKFNEFKASLESNEKNFVVFLKNSLISNLVVETRERYVTFFEKIEEILIEARLNFNVYLHELSLDKIKSEYKEYKLKYYSSQNEILGKITNQIIALPFSIAASAFSLYKLEGEKFAISIIGLGLIAFVVYMSFVISLHVKDLSRIKEDLTRDYNLLSDQIFFQENSEELSYFRGVKDNLFKRLCNLFIGVKLFTFFLWGIVSALVYYALHLNWGEFHPVETISFFLAVIVGFVLVYRNFLFRKENRIKCLGY